MGTKNIHAFRWVAKFGLIFSVFAVVSLGLSLIFSNNTAFATGCPGFTNNSYTSANLPSSVQNYFWSYDCTQNNPNQPATSTWISKQGDPTETPNAPVTNPNSSFPLQLNSMTYLYHQEVNGGVYYPTNAGPNGSGGIDSMVSKTYISSITPYSNGQPWGCVTSDSSSSGNPCLASSGGGYPGGDTMGPLNPNGGSRYWPYSPVPFYFVPPGGKFTKTVTVTFKMQYTQIEQWNGVWYCVGSGGVAPSPPPNNSAPWGCGTYPASMTINFTVQTPPGPTYNIDNATCTQLSGWAFDSNDSSASINVDVYVNGPAGSGAPGKRYLANYPRPDVDSAYHITGNHGFNIDPQTSSFLGQYAKSGSSFKVYLYAIGINSQGQPDGNNPLMGIRTISCGSTSAPCPTFPNYSSVDNNLPYRGKNVAPPIGDTTNSTATAEEDTPLGVGVTKSPSGATYTNQGSIQDISNGGSRYPPKEVSEINGSASAPGGSTSASNGSITLDYSSYVKNYPYDINQPGITYYSYWQVQKWDVTFDYYSCPGGGSLSGSTCTETTNAGQTCTTTTNKKTGTSTTTCTNNPCPSPYSGSGGSNCSYSYGATAYYKWQTDGGAYTQSSSSNINGVMMPACYNRTFNLTPEAQSHIGDGSVSVNHQANSAPNSVNYTGYVHAQFGESNTPTQLRVASQVQNINTYINWQVYYVDKNGTVHIVNGFNGSQTVGPSTYTGNTSESNNFSTTATSATISTGPLSPGDMVCVDLIVNPYGTQTSPGNQINGTQSAQNQIPTNSWGSPWYYEPPGAGARQQVTGPEGAGNLDNFPTNGSQDGTAPTGVCSVPYAHRPYFKVFNGDVLSGVGTQTFLSSTSQFDQCTSGENVNKSAGIEGWNKGGANGYAGAGTQLAALALDNINMFATAQNYTGSPPPAPPVGLTFSNTQGSWGGSFATPPSCLPDYYNQGVNGDGGASFAQPTTASSILGASGPITGSPPLPGHTFSVTSIVIPSSGSYLLKGSQNIPATTIYPGEHLIVYIDGSATVTGNITYNYSGITNSSSPKNLPSLTVIANGGINVGPGVTQLDGTYIAENGNFNDCYGVNPINFYPDSSNPSAQTCHSQLVVNGSVVSNNYINLYRTNGSLYMSSPSETSTSSPHSAEIFNYSPIVWLSTAPTLRTLPVEAQSSLPPLL